MEQDGTRLMVLKVPKQMNHEKGIQKSLCMLITMGQNHNRQVRLLKIGTWSQPRNQQLVYL